MSSIELPQVPSFYKDLRYVRGDYQLEHYFSYDSSVPENGILLSVSGKIDAQGNIPKVFQNKKVFGYLNRIHRMISILNPGPLHLLNKKIIEMPKR